MLIKIFNKPRFHISIKLQVIKCINSLTLTLICEFNIKKIHVNTYTITIFKFLFELRKAQLTDVEY